MSWADEHRLRALESKVRHLEDANAFLTGVIEKLQQARAAEVVQNFPKTRRRGNLEGLIKARAVAKANREAAARELVGRDIATSYEEDAGELPPGATA